MASNGREQLIRTFMSRNRRKTKPGGIDQGFPKVPGGTLTFKPGKTSPVVDQKLYRSEQNYPNPAPFFVPGYGGVQAERGAQKLGQIQATHDQTTNSLKQRGSNVPVQKAPYRGKRRRPRVNPRNAYNPGRRPTLN